MLTHPLAPGRIYAALGDGLMQRGRSYAESRDGGDTWHYSGDGLGEFVYLYAMAVNPADPDDVLVAGSPSPRAAHGEVRPVWSSPARSALSGVDHTHNAEGPSSIFRRSGDRWIEDAEGFPKEKSLIPILATDASRPGDWLALSNLGLFARRAGSDRWEVLANTPEWLQMHAMCLLAIHHHRG